MKFFNFIICFFFINVSFAQLAVNTSWTEKSSMPAAELIYYHADKFLHWDDFQGTPAADNGFIAAITVSGFGYNASLKTVNDKGELTISVYCYFSKKKSWVKPGKKTAYILNHEQHHFDVSYIAAVIFMDKIQNTVFTTTNYNELLPRIYKESCAAMNKMQNDYDAQTKNGQLKEEQERWNNLINLQITAFTK